MSAFTITSTFEGNLVADPELRFTRDGTAVCNFRVAVTQRIRVNNEYVDRTEFVNVVAWRHLAEHTAMSLVTGSRVIVSGDLKQRSFDGNDGQRRYITEIHAQMVGLSLRWHVLEGEMAKQGNTPAQPSNVSGPDALAAAGAPSDAAIYGGDEPF